MNNYEFKQLKKACKLEIDGKLRKVAVLGNVSTQFVSKAVEGYGKLSMVNIQVYDAEYNQIDLQLRDTNSGLYAFAPDYILLYLSTEKLYEKFMSLDESARKMFAELSMEEIEAYWDIIDKNLGARIIQTNFTEVDDRIFGNYSCKVSSSFIFQLRKLNYMLEERMEARNSVFPLDLLSVQIGLGASAFFDDNLYYDSKMAISLDALPDVAKNVIDIINSADGKIKKCLILDLDNTLWGGIIGDDGIDGIQIGEYGIGHVYSSLQAYYKQLKEAGIILCVCSKNEESVAREPFEKLDDMVLKLSDFAVFIANWNDKAENIKVIQETLNIGFDSMVFVDDSPFERGIVREKLPQVAVPEMPENPAEYLRYLQSENYFETAGISSENKNRTQQYQTEYERIRAKREYGSIDDYLMDLKMEARAHAFDPMTYNRIAQLTQRSNQFNLRTIRYTADDIKRIAEDTDYKTIYFELRDRYGDYGLISVIILKKMEEEEYFVDTWLMSCRVLNRGVEEYVMNYIAAALRRDGIAKLAAEYIPTTKNVLVKDLLDRMGFSKSDSGQYELLLSEYRDKVNYIAEVLD